VRVVQGPVQRLFRLATVVADTAGGRSGQAHDRDVHEAWALAEQLAVRARLARRPAPVTTDREAAEPDGVFEQATMPGPDELLRSAEVPEAADDSFWRRPVEP
jgi:uncharacterized membrane protein YdbT with pleckstrin-like domain